MGLPEIDLAMSRRQQVIHFYSLNVQGTRVGVYPPFVSLLPLED
jgi:hypothetical protein